jgi:hypothetical protein
VPLRRTKKVKKINKTKMKEKESKSSKQFVSSDQKKQSLLSSTHLWLDEEGSPSKVQRLLTTSKLPTVKMSTFKLKAYNVDITN